MEHSKEQKQKEILIMKLFVNVKNENCNVASHVLLPNGLLEICMPKNSTADDVTNYIRSIKPEWNNINEVQKKATKAFRKKVYGLISKYEREFCLKNLSIGLRISPQMSCFGKTSIEIRGLFFDGTITLLHTLQYCSDEIIEKIVRSIVCELAFRFEELWSKIIGIESDSVNFQKREIDKVTLYKVSDDRRYHVPVDSSVIEQIVSDAESAASDYNIFVNKNKIGQINYR